MGYGSSKNMKGVSISTPLEDIRKMAQNMQSRNRARVIMHETIQACQISNFTVLFRVQFFSFSHQDRPFKKLFIMAPSTILPPKFPNGGRSHILPR